MKKLSISFLAIVAIVIATASAFTTRTIDITEGWYLALPGEEPANPGENTKLPEDYSPLVFESNTFGPNPPIVDGQFCSAGSKVCAAYFDASGENQQDDGIYVVIGERSDD